MTTDKQVLWDKIKKFELDDPDAALSFTKRLSRENGWTLEYSIRTVYEYKKFIFMLCISDHSLTPSDQVDQVWHLHLLYTHSYWIDLCQQTLGRQIHHGPTKGGKAEGDKYSQLYEKTLQLYKTLFEYSAPIDIWPSSEIRFSEINFQRVNLDKNWIIHKPQLFQK
jgi:hypothetical protein